MKKFILALALVSGCSYGIKEQRELISYARRAKEICAKDSTKCTDSIACRRLASDGIKAIQTTQENKLNGVKDQKAITESIFNYKTAVRACQQF